MNIEHVMQHLPSQLGASHSHSHSHSPHESHHDQPVDSTFHTISIPLIGRIRCVKDSQGQMLLSCIVAYWLYGVFSVYYIILVPAYDDGLIPSFVTYTFLAVAALCVLALLRASFCNPGSIPSSSEADSTWNMCRTCNCLRPPRAHHCRRCGQCVNRMDHHCPWINNCVGEANHYAFMQLLFYAFLLGAYALVLNLLHFWVFPKCVSCNREAFHIKHSIWFMYLTFILSLNMAVVMGGQFYQQHFNLLVNITVLESMAAQKSQIPLVPRSQLRKCYSAYRELCGQGLPIFWFWPLGKRRSVLPYQIQNTV